MASSGNSDTSSGGGGNTRAVVLGGALLLALVVIAGIGSVFHFVDKQRAYELQNWQIRLGIVADSRAAAVESWVEQQFTTLSELSENASLQLYMTELSLSKSEGNDTGDMPEGSYLRNLLVVTAENAGFNMPRQNTVVAANVEQVGQAGIALTDHLGNLLVATPQMPPISPAIKHAMAEAAAGKRALVDLHTNSAGMPAMGFVVPVYAVQQDASTSDNIGYIVGLRVVGSGLFNLLKQPGDTTQSSETYLVRKDGSTVEYLSPLADGTEGLKRRLAADTPNLAAAYVIDHPGGFAEMRDYRGKPCLVTGRALAAAPWFLVRKIGRDEAIADSDQRQRTLLTVFILIILGVAGAIIAVWRHGASMRSAQLAAQYKKVSSQLEEYSHFMEVVSDSQPTEICVVDEEGHYTFANRTASEAAGIPKGDMLGKGLASVIGPVRAKELESANREALHTLQPISHMHRFEGEAAVQIVRSDHIPLDNDGRSRNVLMVLQDITDVVRERERREQTMRNLVRTLVAIVDQRDPYSAHQSARVAEVSVEIAREMGLPDDAVQTVDIAGSMVNLGKILVPKELLTKTGRLTDSERDFIRQSIQNSADLLEQVDFELPVQDTLRQIQENWDGSGYPKGLRGEDILISARIIAIANAFVGMVSPRAYRDALPFDKAYEILMADTGSKFDRRPVTALVNVIENRGGRQRWQHYQNTPKEPA